MKFGAKNTKLNPALASSFMVGTLNRIKKRDPVFHSFLVAEINRKMPAYIPVAGLGDLGDWTAAIGQFADKFGSIASTAATKYGDVLISREQGKTASMMAREDAKNQIAQMNASLKLQKAQTQNQYAQQELQRQQMALLNTGGFSGGLTTWAPIALAAAGLLWSIMRDKRARR